jgi:hypothetical protein
MPFSASSLRAFSFQSDGDAGFILFASMLADALARASSKNCAR